jgi:hypothetical protein
MKRLVVIVAALLTLAGVSAVTATASSASVCEPNGTGCTQAGTYPGPNAVISNDDTGFKVEWTKSVVQPYSSGVPLYWTAYVTYTNIGSSTLTLSCSGNVTDTSADQEHMSGGSGNDGTVGADSTTCSQNPSFTEQVPPGGTGEAYATFHNVPWPGSAVSITWGDAGTSPNVYPFASKPPNGASTDKCRIDVRGTGFAYGIWPSNLIADHLWVVYTDMTGAQYHYEDLPNPFPWNPLNQGYNQTSQGTGAKSRVGKMTDGPVTALSGAQACGKDSSGNPVPGFDPNVVTQGPHACFLSQMAQIDKAKVPYRFLTTNSNAFVHTILLLCGIKPVKPNVYTPGWDYLLNHLSLSELIAITNRWRAAGVAVEAAIPARDTTATWHGAPARHSALPSCVSSVILQRSLSIRVHRVRIRQLC